MSTPTQDLAPIKLRSQRLVNTEIFDPQYYAAEIGKVFASRQAAAHHFVQFGMKSGMSFHPLFDLGMFPVALRDRYKSGDVDYLLAYLRSDASREHVWSFLFDPAQMTGEGLERSTLLSKFRPNKETALPVPKNFVGTPPAWTEARALLIKHATTLKGYERAKKPLRLKSWSEKAEMAWLKSVRTADQPSTYGSVIVTVVMPVWNRETTVSAALDSVRGQAFGSWELLVVDDGSTDGTRDVVRGYARTDPRIRLVEAEHLGVCAARNRGVEEAQGKFLAFLDSDNTWRPDFLQNMVAGLQSTDSRAGYAAIRMLNGRDEFLGQPVDAVQLLMRNYVDLNVLVAETSLIRDLGGFDTTLRRWVDYDLVLRILETASIEYFPFIGCDYLDDDSDDRITRRESANWEHAVVGKNIETRLFPDAPVQLPATPALSVVIRVTGNVSVAVRSIRKLVEGSGDDAVELVVVDDLVGFRQSLRLRSALAGLGSAKYIKLPRRYTDAIALNVGAVHATGKTILFVKDSVEFRSDALDALLKRLQDPSVAAVQPLLTDPSGVVVSAGAVRQKNSMAIPLFRGLNIADAQRHDGRALDELSSSAFMLRAETFARLGRFNYIFAGEATFADFFRRLAQLNEGDLATESAALAVDHSADAASEPEPVGEADLMWLTAPQASMRTVEGCYREIGLEVIGFAAPKQPKLQPASPMLARLEAARGSSTEPALRWAIKIGAEFTAGGDRWGDVPYAADLASALTARGQNVVVDRAHAMSRPSNHLDDVVLVIRGLHPCDPQAGKINMLWAISRPDLISKEELLGFDVVFGASRIWCEHVRKEWGIDAHYLPQATNPERFRPRHSDAELVPEYDLTFVGGPRKPIGRKIVADCLATGRRVNVWGPRWDQFVPPEMVVSDFVHNDALVDVYNSSKIVLNDHFADMAEWGFANNRLYDAVASGARVISDDVDGIAEIFKGAVQTYSSLEELGELLADTSAFPDDAEMAAISQMVRDEHNFDVRAESLLAAALAFRVSECQVTGSFPGAAE